MQPLTKQTHSSIDQRRNSTFALSHQKCSHPKRLLSLLPRQLCLSMCIIPFCQPQQRALMSIYCENRSDILLLGPFDDCTRVAIFEPSNQQPSTNGPRVPSVQKMLDEARANEAGLGWTGLEVHPSLALAATGGTSFVFSIAYLWVTHHCSFLLLKEDRHTRLSWLFTF